MNLNRNYHTVYKQVGAVWTATHDGRAGIDPISRVRAR
jgi:hypothetical protein